MDQSLQKSTRKTKP